LQSFVRLYSFLSQLIDWQEIELEKLYPYARHLLAKLPYRNRDDMLHLDAPSVLSTPPPKTYP
jgi:type I restriction enzyme R subunit